MFDLFCMSFSFDMICFLWTFLCKDSGCHAEKNPCGKPWAGGPSTVDDMMEKGNGLKSIEPLVGGGGGGGRNRMCDVVLTDQDDVISVHQRSFLIHIAWVTQLMEHHHVPGGSVQIKLIISRS